MNKNLSVAPGFSLIELSIVIVLVALISGLTLTTISFFNQFLIRSELRKLHAACLYMQQCACTSNRAQQLHLDAAHNAYSFDGKKEQLASGVRFGLLPGVKGSPGSPETKLNNSITFSNDCITFYPNGIIQAGTVYFVDVHNNYMYALSCGVSHTSHVRLYAYNGTWHVLR